MRSQKPNSSSSFREKWSAAIEAKGFAPIPNCLIFCQHELGIENAEFKTLVYLIACKFTTEDPWPGVKSIATSSGSAVGTVRNHLRDLEAKGLIKRVYRTRQSSKYDLSPLIHRLESHNCINPIKKRVVVSPKMNRFSYSKTNTKEDELKRRSKKNTGMSSMKEMLDARTRPP